MFVAAVLTFPEGGVAAWLPLLARRRTDRHASTRHGTRNPVGPEARSFIWDRSGEDCRTQSYARGSLGGRTRTSEKRSGEGFPESSLFGQHLPPMDATLTAEAGPPEKGGGLGGGVPGGLSGVVLIF